MLAVTFTSRAAGEMRTRLRAMEVAGVQALTFHAADMDHSTRIDEMEFILVGLRAWATSV